MVRLLGAAPRPSRLDRDALLLRHNLGWCRRRRSHPNLLLVRQARRLTTPQRQGMEPQVGIEPNPSTLPKWRADHYATAAQAHGAAAFLTASDETPTWPC